jgi:excisionase family DNA binding protein
MKAELNIDHQELVEEVTREVIKALRPLINPKGRDGDRLLTTNELCDYLRVDRGWVYQQVHSKAIPFHKAGNKLRFRKIEIDKYLSKGRK